MCVVAVIILYRHPHEDATAGKCEQQFKTASEYGMPTLMQLLGLQAVWVLEWYVAVRLSIIVSYLLVHIPWLPCCLQVRIQSVEWILID